MGKEIERKWLVFDDISKFGEPIKKFYMEQFYTEIDIDEEIRYRMKKDLNTGHTKYYKTIKRGTGMSREEIEDEITALDYNENTDNAVSIIIKKIRSVYSNGFEVDNFINWPILITVEKEFDNELHAKQFEFPEHISVLEATNDAALKNKNLAKYGLPDKVFHLIESKTGIKTTFETSVMDINCFQKFIVVSDSLFEIKKLLDKLYGIKKVIPMEYGFVIELTVPAIHVSVELKYNYPK